LKIHTLVTDKPLDRPGLERTKRSFSAG